MFEPTYIPKLDKALPQISFGISYSTERKDQTYKPDPIHFHNYLEIFFNLSNDVAFLVNNELYPVPFGNAIVSRPEELHMGLINWDSPHEFYCLWIDTDFSYPLFSFLHKPDFSPLFSFNADTKRKLCSLFVSLAEAINGAELEKTALLFQILSIFEKGQFQSPKQFKMPLQFQKVLDDINQNFAVIHNVSSLLERHYLSSTTLNRWFRTYIHSSPREYLESVRLSNALSMLLSGETVTDACLNSGFSDCSHFIVLFKKRFGTTPKKYIKKINGN